MITSERSDQNDPMIQPDIAWEIAQHQDDLMGRRDW
jgi:hypothetical protein